jgi:hypothetical protein
MPIHAVPGSGDGHNGMLGIEVIVHELRCAADRSWRFRRPSVAGMWTQRPAFERSLGRSRLPGHHLGDHCTGLQCLPSSDGILASGNSPVRGQVVEAGGHADFVDLQVGSGAALPVPGRDAPSWLTGW